MAALYMLDTDISSYIIKARPPQVAKRLRRIAMDQVCVSIVTVAELYYGVKRSSSSKVNRLHVDDYLRHVSVREWDIAAAEHFAEIRTALDSAGRPIGAYDLMIAAHARSLGAVLVTNNRKHFDQVAKLKVENWVD